MSREVALQICPFVQKQPKSVHSTAVSTKKHKLIIKETFFEKKKKIPLSMSTSSNTTIGLFPPSSSVTGYKQNIAQGLYILF